MSTPVLHIFNPWHDLALANYRPNYQPPASSVQMAHDLCLLPQCLATEGDVVWTPGLSWRDVPSSFEVCPWGWDLVVRNQLEKWNPHLQLPSVEVIDTIRRLSSRTLAVDTLAALRGKLPGQKWHPESFLCTSVEEVLDLQHTYPETLLKLLWSSSGKGLKPVHGSADGPTQNWCRKAIVQHGGVVLEPRYDRVQDFALEFFSSGSGDITFTGYSVFLTFDTGRYSGNLLAPDASLEAFICQKARQSSPSLLHAIRQQLIIILQEKVASCYCGPLGIDMMVVSTPGDELFFHPCVEINLRHTMGQVAHSISKKYLHEGYTGLFQIHYSATEGEQLRLHQQQLTQPGYMAITPVKSTTHYRAFLELMP